MFLHFVQITFFLLSLKREADSQYKVLFVSSKNRGRVVKPDWCPINFKKNYLLIELLYLPYTPISVYYISKCRIMMILFTFYCNMWTQKEEMIISTPLFCQFTLNNFSTTHWFVWIDECVIFFIGQ